MAWCLVKHRHNFTFTFKLTHSIEQSPSWQLIVIELVWKFPDFYGTRRFVTMFTAAHHLSLSWARFIQSTLSHPISIRFIILLSSHLQLSLPIGLFHSWFLTKILNTFLISPIHAAFPVHPYLFGKMHKLLSSSLHSLLHPPATFSLLDLNILLSTLLSNILNLYSSLRVWYQVSHPCKTGSNIIVLYILIFKFLEKRQKDKRFTHITEV